MGIWLVGLIACAPRPQPAGPTAPPLSSLVWFHTATPSATGAPAVTPASLVTPTPLPSATSTPRTHVVQKGEDMGGIAYRYQVGLADLMAANPQVNPNQMAIGTVLIIPPAGGARSAPDPTLTPLPVEPGPLRCYPSQDGGAWCFLFVRNPYRESITGVRLAVRIPGQEAGAIREQVGQTVLEQLPGGSSLPVAVYFPAPLPADGALHRQPGGFFLGSAELLSAFPLGGVAGRYLPVRLDGLQTAIAADGLSAQVQGKVVLDAPAASDQVARVRVAVAALDEGGWVIGVRLWEDQKPLAGQEGLAFRLWVYSVGEKIARLEAWAEAIPIDQ